MVSAAKSDVPSEPPRARPPAPREPRRHSGQRGSAPAQRDAFAFMFAFGRRQMRVGLMIGLAGTLVVHGAAAARGLSTLLDLATFAITVRALIEQRLHATYDLDMTPPPEVKAPEPEPPPPEPEEKKPVARAAEPPPAPAEAAKVLTSEPDPSDAPVDLTGWGIVSGNSDRFPGGQTSSKGTSTKPVATGAVASGIPNATGRAPTAAAPAKDLSRTARPAESGWNCGFPAEADMEQINSEKVLIVVTVSPDGNPTKVSVLSDPGFGFGRVARQCAMRKTYTAGLDRAGNPVTTTTPPITVRFIR